MEANEIKKKFSRADWIAIIFGVILVAAFATVETLTYERNATIHKHREIERQKMDEQLKLNHALEEENELLHSKKAILEKEITIYKMLIIPAYDSLLKVNNVKPTKDFPKYKKMLHFK